MSVAYFGPGLIRLDDDMLRTDAYDLSENRTVLCLELDGISNLHEMRQPGDVVLRRARIQHVAAPPESANLTARSIQRATQIN